jgi:hypothetical protein
MDDVRPGISSWTNSSTYQNNLYKPAAALSRPDIDQHDVPRSKTPEDVVKKQKLGGRPLCLDFRL